ncbi:MAG: ketoacyl-ACP synthase III [Planctomycetes bacterium]|nr:ketoacyl-ACP synthase III [Planctomycetota bacterium]
MRGGRGVKVLGTGSFAPERRLTNDDLSRMVDTSDAWIVERTGVRERRIAAAETTASDLASEAAKRALEAAELGPEDLDMIVFATSSPDRIVPASAVYLQKKLGAFNAGAVDNLAACSGFVYAFTSGASMVASGTSERCLVVGGEVLSKITDYQDRTTCILMGDAAGAVVLGPSEDGSDVLYAKMRADGRLEDFIIVPASGYATPPTDEAREKRQTYIRMKGREVYKFGVPKFVEAIRDALAACEMTLEDLDLLIPHQMNLRMIEAVAERLPFPMSRVLVNIQKYGNTSSASIPLALDEAVRGGRIRRGDRILLTAMGAGLTWGTIVLRW